MTARRPIVYVAGRRRQLPPGDTLLGVPATEWTAETVAQAEAEAGTAQTRRAWTSQRVRQAIAAWWNGSAAKTQLDAASSGITSLQASKLDATANAVSATKLATARTIGGVAFDGTANITLPGVNAGGNQSTTGNAATATALQTARTINGVAFDGTANITVADATKEPSIAAGTAQQFWRGNKAWGTIAASDVPSLDASKLATGVIADGRLPERLRAAAATITDWNNATENGWYMGSSAANAPVAGPDWFAGDVVAHNVNWVTQTVSQFTSDLPTDTKTWRRDRNNGTWGAWYRLRLSEAEQSALYNNASNLSSGIVPDARLSGTYTGVNITGNAATATKLTTARTIGGVSFDGTASINLPGVNAAGNQSTSGNAATATKLATARTINGVAFDGTANITVADATKQAAHANLSALSGLTGAADRLPYFTGADALSLTTLTGLARNLLDDTTQSGMQSTLGLGTASTRTALGTTGALYSRDSILGTVSQSGGVPTGAIIERGSNANGEYVRFADGTQICSNVSTSLSYAQVAVGAMFTGSVADARDFTFPATFASVPAVTSLAQKTVQGASGGTGGVFPHISNGGPTTTGVNVSSNGATSTASAYLGYIAIGRWY